MPAKPSGEIKTKIVPVHQKNGDIYLMERQIQYDPVKKYNKVLSSKLVSKIPKGEKNPVPTRPKAAKGHKSSQIYHKSFAMMISILFLHDLRRFLSLKTQGLKKILFM